jgi:hypothetical protein
LHFRSPSVGLGLCIEGEIEKAQFTPISVHSTILPFIPARLLENYRFFSHAVTLLSVRTKEIAGCAPPAPPDAKTKKAQSRSSAPLQEK